jgi:CTP-dependent riboflavin kinase
MIVRGRIRTGIGAFKKIMSDHQDVFNKCLGMEVYPGNLNVELSEPLPVHEDCRIKGVEINRPCEDFVFERCVVAGRRAFRVRPLNATGGGGHGDQVLELVSDVALRPLLSGREAAVDVEFFR